MQLKMRVLPKVFPKTAHMSLKNAKVRATNSDEETCTSETSASSVESSEEPTSSSTTRRDQRRNRNRINKNKFYNPNNYNNRGVNNTNQRKNNNRNKNKQRKPYKSKATSTKPHDAPMQKRDMYFALDCEMVGVGPNGLESALARLSIINWDNELVFDTFVRVDEPVTDYRTFVSGIRAEDIESDAALPIEQVRLAATSILSGKILIGHGLETDLKVIGISHPWCDVRDTATYEPFMREVTSEGKKINVPRKLKDLTWEFAGKEIQTIGMAHCPIEDALAPMELYKTVRAEWEAHLSKQVNQVNVVEDRQDKKRDESSSFFFGKMKKVAIHPTTNSGPYYPQAQMQHHQQRQPQHQMSPQRRHYRHRNNHHKNMRDDVPRQQHYDQYTISPQQIIGGPYHNQVQHQPSHEDRLAAARLAQQQACARAQLALQYQQQQLPRGHYQNY